MRTKKDHIDYVYGNTIAENVSMRNPVFIDLFAGAGGLSEGFIRAGFTPVAHVESELAACNTLKTRMAYHWLSKNGKIKIYHDYLNQKISRNELYSSVADSVLTSVINMEINKQNLSLIFHKIDSLLKQKHIDVIIGGPPCQAYSLVGRSKDKNRMLLDDRNYLYKFYAQFLDRYQPKMFVFENVTGLLSAKAPDGSKHLDNMCSLFEQKGYTVEHKTIVASDYGIPQHRKRVIIIGSKGDKQNFFDRISKKEQQYLVKDILADLPPLNANEGKWESCKTICKPSKYLVDKDIAESGCPITQHVSRYNSSQDLEIYRIAVDIWNKNNVRLEYDNLPERLKTHKNRDKFKDRFKVVDGNAQHSHTVLAHLAKDGHYYIHPDIKQNRSLTPREAARLQTFPDNYYFESKNDKPTLVSSFRQIGNAVPVMLAYEIAKAVKEDL